VATAGFPAIATLQTTTDPGGSGGSGGGSSDSGSSDGGFVAGELIAAMPSAMSVILPGLVVTDYVVVSSRRTGRTRMEYVLRLKISNSGSDSYDDVMATLLFVPNHILIVDSIATIGKVPANSTILSPDSFTVDVNLAESTLFEDLVWLIEGDVSSPPPPSPPGPRPTRAGIFMSIDNNSIPGESNSDSHRDWIELTRIMEGLHRDGAASSSGGSRLRSSFVFDGVQVMKLLDRSSPKLRQALAQGEIFGEVKIDVIKACGGNPYTAYAITLSIARIEALSLQAEDFNRPTEELAFNYTRIETMFTPVDRSCTLLPPIYSTQDGEILEL